uniref:BZIP domain-containing protein n=1 Tax=Macrostomum lignano TaxID=282301 RepID=A0A1I8I3X0_9PLAT
MAESTAQDLAYDEDFLQPFEPLSYHSGGRAVHSGLDSAVSNLDLFAQLELAHLDPFSSAAAAAAAACLANSSLSEQMSRSDSCLAAAAAAAADAEEAGVGNPLFEPEDSARTDAGVGGAGAGSLLLGNSVAGMTTSVSQSSANVKQILGKSASPNYQVVVGMDASVAMSGASAGSNMNTWMALAKSNKRFVSTSDLEASDDATADDSRLPAAAATSAGSGRPPMTTWSAVRTSSIKDVSAAASPGVANGNNNAPGRRRRRRLLAPDLLAAAATAPGAN